MNARSGAFSWVAETADKLAKKSVEKRMIDPLLPKIEKFVHQGQVVLVILQYRQWKSANGAGYQEQRAHYAYIGATSDTRYQAYIIHKNKQTMPLLKPAPPLGWVNGEEVYIWFEDEQKQKEQNKTNVGNLYWKVVK